MGLDICMLMLVHLIREIVTKMFQLRLEKTQSFARLDGEFMGK